MAITLRKKIKRQKALGNQQKVRKLRPPVAAKSGIRPEKQPGKLTGGISGGSSTGSTSEQAANQPSPQPTSAPTPSQSQPSSSGDLSSFANVTSYNPASGQPDPRDSEYWADLAALQAQAQQDYATQQLEQTSSDAAYGLKLSQAGEQRRQEVRGTAESLIGTGLLRSGAHNRRQTEGTIGYMSQLAGWGQEKTSADAARKAQMQAILSNLGLSEMGLYTAASGRYADAQAEAAAGQSALADLGAPPTAGKKKRKRKKKK